VLLRSTDRNVVHEALVLARDVVSAPEVTAEVTAEGTAEVGPELAAEVAPGVMAVLEKLLAEPVDEEAGTRRLACDVLGKLRDARAVPVLLKALEDPYYHSELLSVGEGRAAERTWYAVWRDADRALRAITGASPIDQPRMREPQVPEVPDALRDAWQAWWKAHQGES
jgi:hypothetical protein